MIDRRTARRLSAQLKELRRRRGVREAARAVQAFTSRYDGVTTVPHMGDFDLGQGKVTLREAKRRESMERRELIRTATQLHRLLESYRSLVEKSGASTVATKVKGSCQDASMQPCTVQIGAR